MTPDRWREIERLFHEALARPPAERAAFLEKACAGDDELRREVESLAKSDDDAGSFIEHPALEALAAGIGIRPKTESDRQISSGGGSSPVQAAGAELL
jgi:eukaryotic-like serine/threonine-protein kinase